MKRLLLNVLALLVISGGTAHLFAMDETVCCRAASGAVCCGDTCKAGRLSCCTNSSCGPDAPA
jgi:hypothetical protein